MMDGDSPSTDGMATCKMSLLNTAICEWLQFMFAVPFLLYLRVNSYAWGRLGQVEVHGGSQALGYKILPSK